MQAILGPFHPHLENALVEEICKYKNADLLCPLLVLVPSDALRRRLKVLLTRERNLSFLNLQLLTFFQLSAKLFAEAEGLSASILREELFLEEALRQIIRTRQPGTESFSGIEERAGGCAALWQSLRDLRDGMVQPEVAAEALREGHFDSRTEERTANLLVMLRTFLGFCHERDIRDHSTLDKFALAQAPTSLFLSQFAQIFYYGFYDLTQIQVDLFHAIAQTYPTTLFFPLLQTQPVHEGWQFAARFYQGYVQGRAATEATNNLVIESAHGAELPQSFALFDQHPQRQYQSMPPNWRCRIFNTFGIHDEISVVAKEILLLTGEAKMAFDQIGVVARTLDDYGATIKEVFAQHNIPISGSIEEPLVQFPLTKAAILLMKLPAQDYLRSHVIDLLSSPYFRLNGSAKEPHELRTDLWDLASRELAICKGIEEWQRIDRYTSEGMKLFRVSDDDGRRFVDIPAAQLRALGTILKTLHNHLAQLAQHASWNEYADSWKKLFAEYLGIEPEPSADFNAADRLISKRIIETLDEIAGLDAVQDNVSLGDFTEILERWLERSTIVETDKNVGGVAVSSASAARGIRFRALFIVGMNEGVFPRTIREDAFLRDRDREVLERDLGYKVSQKLAAFDEEKLIFTLLANSVSERLYCSFQRSDESGRALAPSWYLDELKRAFSGAKQKPMAEDTIPRSAIDKASCHPFDREELLLPSELAIRLNLTGRDSKSLIEAADLSPNLYKQGLENIRRIDLSTERVGMFDGMIQAPAKHWLRFAQHGLSPTALELYARCPFQYFARQVLGLEQLEIPEEVIEPSVAEAGKLGHDILKATYQVLIDAGHFTNDSSLIDVDDVLSAASQDTFTKYETKHPVGYPLLWASFCEGLTELTRAILHADLEDLRQSGYTPVELELGITGQLADDWPEVIRGLAIRGRIDRLDVDRTRNRLRIVDYKFKRSSSATAAEKDLDTAALRGEKLQPPIYSLLGKYWAEANEREIRKPQIEASLFYIAPGWSDGPLVRKTFSAVTLASKVGEEIIKTIAELVAGIRAGRFFMQPGHYCKYCEVAEICRKNHPPSLWRTENDPITAPHRQLREKDSKKC
jgi:ATP-dependent helicase/nuclease subunit B